MAESFCIPGNVQAALYARSWKYTDSTFNGSPAVRLVFGEMIRISEMFLLPQQDEKFDVLMRPKFTSPEDYEVPAATAAAFFTDAPQSPIGKLEIGPGGCPALYLRGLSTETAVDELAATLGDFALAYSPFQIGLVGLATRGLTPAAAAAAVVQHIVATRTDDDAALKALLRSMRAAMDGLGLAYEDMEDGSGLHFGVSTEVSRWAVRVQQMSVSVEGTSASERVSHVTVRIIMPDQIPAARRAEAALLVSMANFGLSLGHWDVDPDSGHVVCVVELFVEPCFSEEQTAGVIASAFRRGLSIADKYHPALQAVISGSATATEAIGLAEAGDAPAFPACVSGAAPPAPAPGPGEAAALEAFSQAFGAAFRGALLAAGPPVPIRGPGRDSSDRTEQGCHAAIFAALTAIGIVAMSEEKEGEIKFIRFGVNYDEEYRAGVEIRWVPTTNDLGGPRVLARIFDVSKACTAALRPRVSEFVARANFGLSFGAFDIEPQSAGGIVSYDVTIRCPDGTSESVMTAAVHAGLSCALQTHRRYLPGLSYLLADTESGGANRTVSEALRLVPGESAEFDLTAAIAAAPQAAAAAAPVTTAGAGSS